MQVLFITGSFWSQNWDFLYVNNVRILDVHPEPEITPPKKSVPTDREREDSIDQESATSPTKHTVPEVIMNRKPEDRHTSFFAQPGILAGERLTSVGGSFDRIVVCFSCYRWSGRRASLRHTGSDVYRV